MKLIFVKKENDFCLSDSKLIDFLCEIEFRYGGNEFCSCKIDSLFCKVELHVGNFQFCSGEIDIHFGEIQMEKVYSGLGSKLSFWSSLTMEVCLFRSECQEKATKARDRGSLDPTTCVPLQVPRASCGRTNHSLRHHS